MFSKFIPLTDSYIQSAFKKSVLVPFNLNIISNPKIAPSTSCNRDVEQTELSVGAQTESSVNTQVSAK